jgi:hypothetical protein
VALLLLAQLLLLNQEGVQLHRAALLQQLAVQHQLL